MKKIIKLCICLALCLTLFVTNAFSLSKIGSRSQEVRQIQTALKQKGYFDSRIDGIFGTLTKKAVERFQKDNGLTVDGIAGENTLKALGIKNADNKAEG